MIVSPLPSSSLFLLFLLWASRLSLFVVSARSFNDTENCFFDSSSGVNASDCPLSDYDGPVTIFPGGNTQCLFVADAIPYFFQATPGRNADVNNVVLYFSGGGSCNTLQQCNDIRADPYPRPRTLGMFELENPENPFRDWTIVNILYCTGDTQTGNAFFADGTIAFQGQANTKVVLDWLEINLPEPDRLFFSACSAGVSGAQYWMRRILEFYTLPGKSTIISVALDSLMGEIYQFPEYKNTFTNVYNACSLENQRITQEQYEECLAGNWDAVQEQVNILADYRDIPFAFASHKTDFRIGFVYCTGIRRVPCFQATQYRDMQEVMRRYTNTENPDMNNAISYFVNGVGHCMLDQPRFYESGLGLKIFGYRLGKIKDWYAQLAYRDPATTIIESQCSDGPLNFFFVADQECDANLTATRFVP